MPDIGIAYSSDQNKRFPRRGGGCYPRLAWMGVTKDLKDSRGGGRMSIQPGESLFLSELL
jgi:hypothetical protein